MAEPNAIPLANGGEIRWGERSDGKGQYWNVYDASGNRTQSGRCELEQKGGFWQFHAVDQDRGKKDPGRLFGDPWKYSAS